MNMISSFESLNIEKDYTTYYGGTSSSSILSNDPTLHDVQTAVETARNKIAKRKLIPEDHSIVCHISAANQCPAKRGTGPDFCPRTRQWLANAEGPGDLVKLAEDMLPNANECDLLIENYWKIYEFAWGIISKETFENNFKKISIISNNRYKFNIDATKQHDTNYDGYVTLSILLLTLRLGYLSLPFTRIIVTNPNLDLQKLFKSHKYQKFIDLYADKVYIDPEFVEISLELSTHDINESGETIINIPLQLQYLLMLHNYRLIAPEDGDGFDVEESTVLLGKICDLACGINLHRDPDVLHITDPKTKYWRRKIWAYVTLSDAIQSCHLGRPLMLNDCNSDTSPPYQYKEGDMNNSCEYKRKSFYNIIYELSKVLRGGSSLLMNVSNPPRRLDVECFVNDLTSILEVHFPPISEIFIENEETESVRASYLQYMVLCLAELHICYYMLYLNSKGTEESKQKFYLENGTMTALIVLYISLEALNNCEKYFGLETITILVPVLTRNMLRVVQFITSLLISKSVVNIDNYNKEGKKKIETPNHSSESVTIEFINKIPLNKEFRSGRLYSLFKNEIASASLKSLTKYIKEFYMVLKTFSNTYVQSWRLAYVLWSIICIIEKQSKEEQEQQSQENNTDEDISPGKHKCPEEENESSLTTEPSLFDQKIHENKRLKLANPNEIYSDPSFWEGLFEQEVNDGTITDVNSLFQSESAISSLLNYTTAAAKINDPFLHDIGVDPESDSQI